MRHSLTRAAGGALVLAAAAGALTVGQAAPASADIRGSGHSQGITIQTDPKVRLDSLATKDVFCDMHTTGANLVVLQFPLQQAGVHATTITARPNTGRGAYTPSDSELVWAIRHARQCGLDVAVKATPELPVTPDHPRGEWRSHITFSNKQDSLSKAWFASWGDWMVHYAKIAKAEGVDTLVVGTELVGLTADKCYTDPDIPKGIWSCNKNNSRRWAALIGKVRDTDPSLHVTYAAYRGSWNRPKESTSLPTRMTDKLDSVGITFYPTDYAQMKKDRKTYFNKAWSRYHRPIVIEETGFLAGDDQARLYRDLLRFADDTDHVDGLWAFRWANTRASADGVSFTTQKRPANAELAKAFGGRDPYAR